MFLACKARRIAPSSYETQWRLWRVGLPQVVLIQIAVPTRVDVDEYKHLRANVNEMVGSINGQYGTRLERRRGVKVRRRAGGRATL